jgi:hypothetical protein
LTTRMKKIAIALVAAATLVVAGVQAFQATYLPYDGKRNVAASTYLPYD